MITINNQHYKTTDLSEEAKAHLTHLVIHGVLHLLDEASGDFMPVA